MTTILCDLPAELIYEILSHIDNASLVQVAWTCKMLQRISLNTFFERNNIKSPSNHWLVSYQFHPETLPALRAALWVREFKQFSFYFNPGMENLIAEVENMYWLVKRLQKINHVRLYFSFVDTWMSVVSNLPIRVLDRRRWFNAFSALLEVIIERGCTELEISGTGILEEFYILSKEDETEDETEDGTWTSRSTVETISQTSNQTSAKIQTKRTNNTHQALDRFIQQTPNPQGLSHLSILCNMLFLPTFFDWTLKTIAANSSSITTLRFRSVNLPTDKEWSIFLASLSLPHLGDFELEFSTFRTGAIVGFTVLRDFFARHPTIHTLRLQGIDKRPGEKIKVPILPNLRMVMAPSKWISSLLETRHSRRSLSKLVSIGISTEYHYFNFDYGFLNTTLSHLSKVYGRQITLTLRFVYDNSVYTWFSMHASLGKEKSVIGRLSCVSTLVIFFALSVDIKKISIEVLLTWFSLFPSVTCVEFVEAYRLAFRKPEFLKSIAEKCPKMKSFDGVDLDEYRIV